jgi:lipopolysaccharide/colanic/teichoic acid biosynthesis glycosyltransferase
MSSVTTDIAATARANVRTAVGISACDEAAVADYHTRKVRCDQTLAAILLLPAAPLMLVLIALIRATSKGPSVFRQTRTGKDGKQYVMYKLRSMYCDAERATGPAWTQARDPRVTPLGRWLRKLHLDELPQLFNVLRGEMSLVGPRPERPEFVEVLRTAIPHYESRLKVRPGITGLAQINLPPDSDLNSVRRKQALDLQYIAEANALLDIRILLSTTLRIVGVPGAAAARLFGTNRALPRSLEDTVEMSSSLGDTTTLTSLVEQLQSELEPDNAETHVSDPAHARRHERRTTTAASKPRPK